MQMHEMVNLKADVENQLKEAENALEKVDWINEILIEMSDEMHSFIINCRMIVTWQWIVS